jgi:hypothetical protein
MMIFAILALAIFSIGLFLVAVALRSRSVATMNFMICVVAGAVIQPWSTLKLSPPVREDERIAWIAAVVWTFIFLASGSALIYCKIATREKKDSKQRKRRRRRSRSRDRDSDE